jgi:hypothetical protein
MNTRNNIFLIILTISLAGILPSVYAEPTVNIIMDETTYSYCDKLFYIIEVSEITGEPAIIHIRDETGKGSSAIPIAIANLQTPVPSLIAFEKEMFPLGNYFIDVEYGNSKFTVEFNLIDSNKICIPNIIKPILTEWLFTDNFSDGFLLQQFQTYIDKKLIYVPFEINQNNVHDIDIPDWVKNVGYWWIQGGISDKNFAQVISYLIDQNIIFTHIEMENEI